MVLFEVNQLRQRVVAEGFAKVIVDVPKRAVDALVLRGRFAAFAKNQRKQVLKISAHQRSVLCASDRHLQAAHGVIHQRIRLQRKLDKGFAQQRRREHEVKIQVVDRIALILTHTERQSVGKEIDVVGQKALFTAVAFDEKRLTAQYDVEAVGVGQASDAPVCRRVSLTVGIEPNVHGDPPKVDFGHAKAAFRHSHAAMDEVYSS